MNNIYIIRHCKAEGQSPDAALTDEGIAQAHELADFLAPIKVDYIVSSPFKRALQTIQPFADNRNMQIKVDDRLSERVLSPVPMDDWREKLEATYQDLNLKYEGGESSHEAIERIEAVVDDIIASDSDNAIIVAHGGIISLLLYNYDTSFTFDQWKGLSNPDVYLLSFTQGTHNVKRLWEEE